MQLYLLVLLPESIHRLLVRGHRVPYVPEVEERIIAENKTSFMYRYLFYISIILIIILIIVVIRLRKRKKRAEAKLKALKEKELADSALTEKVQTDEKE